MSSAIAPQNMSGWSFLSMLSTDPTQRDDQKIVLTREQVKPFIDGRVSGMPFGNGVIDAREEAAFMGRALAAGVPHSMAEALVALAKGERTTPLTIAKPLAVQKSNPLPGGFDMASAVMRDIKVHPDPADIPRLPPPPETTSLLLEDSQHNQLLIMQPIDYDAAPGTLKLLPYQAYFLEKGTQGKDILKKVPPWGETPLGAKAIPITADWAAPLAMAAQIGIKNAKGYRKVDVSMDNNTSGDEKLLADLNPRKINWGQDNPALLTPLNFRALKVNMSQVRMCENGALFEMDLSDGKTQMTLRYGVTDNLSEGFASTVDPTLLLVSYEKSPSDKTPFRAITQRELTLIKKGLEYKRIEDTAANQQVAANRIIHTLEEMSAQVGK